MSRLGERQRALGPLLRVAKSVSFSQYAEDLMLGVTLLPNRQGRYVDVGAYHPWRTSNTYKLYLRGWSGITIEPNPEMARLFRRTRPRDVHVVCGVAAEPSELTYYRFGDGKLNTFSEEQARACVERGSPIVDRQSVRCVPLQSILDEHAIGPIDFLSVDCEGFDLTALKSINFKKNSPTSIIVEDFSAFDKLKAGSGRSEIEQLLRQENYAHVGQVMFSSLYVHLRALRDKPDTAFRLSQSQIT